MYSKSKMSIKYLNWWLTASNSKGHGMHSPFVFDFIINVLNDDREFYAFKDIEAQASPFSDDGKKVNHLLFKMANYYQANHIVELDAKLGVSTAYLAYANTNAKVIALEEDGKLIDFQENFLDLYKTKNIKLLVGEYEISLSKAIGQLQSLDFVVMGNCSNHSVDYFVQMKNAVHNNSFILVKDIHSSKEAEANWQAIQNQPSVKATIDLFHLGIVLFNQDFKVKQHFKIRF